ncbi:hypothetical protein PWG71_00685 [Nocardiopsis sp. N85]|uniref:hypothetical protein n=1 Tax=Nocardiopsis sp. N85 TaxID=3029400 RepID=UPI00237F18E8|nr:hypothetical protein [Nocardiopsis sp. N85]MDE3719887.1 hypothetical protein [Nocardiopsis sp. N85]
MTPRDPLISERSPLVRTPRPIVPVPSPDALVRDVTAAYPWGVDLTDPDVRITRMAPRVALPPGTPLRGLPVLARREVVPHRDRVRPAGLPVTSAARTAAEVVARAPSVPVATARMDAFLARRSVDTARVSAHRGLFSRAQEARLRTAAEYASPLSQSHRESCVRAIIRQVGSPPPVVRCAARTRERPLHADPGWPAYRVGVEYDSPPHHSEPRERCRDRARYALMRAEGWEVFPVTIHLLQRRTVELSTWIREALETRGWTCSPEEREVVRGRIRAYRRRPPRLR